MNWLKVLLLHLFEKIRPAVKETVDDIIEEGLNKLEEEIKD